MGLWLIVWASILFIALGSFAALGVGLAVYDSLKDGYEPIEGNLASHSAWPTEVYDRYGPEDGTYLGLISHARAQLRIPVELDEISPHMINATVSTEDSSFWDHPGVNARGLFRAVWENYVEGEMGSGTGGSSITQQLVKTVYLSTECEMIDGREVCVAPRTVDRKLREIAYALTLEGDESKEDILSWYLNEISYADRYVGVEAAAQGYFHKSASELTLAEAALLAGIPSSPSQYHPRANCVQDENGDCVVDELGRTKLGGSAKARQEQVLGLMVHHEALTLEEAEEAREETVYIHRRGEETRADIWIASQIEPRLILMCEAGLLPMTPGAQNCSESVQTGGYRVTTTLDWEENERARQLAREELVVGQQNNCDCHNVALVTIDPATGQVPIYVPNIDEDEEDDRRIAGNIDQLMEINQPGSSFKPLIYLAWLDHMEKTPLSSLWDTSPMPLETDPTMPANDDVEIVNPVPGGGGQGLITARTALGSSQNVPAFRAAHETGIETVIEYAQRMGFTTLDQNFDPTFHSHSAVSYGPSIATGGANIRAVDLAYMNATIANMGTMVGVPALSEVVRKGELASAISDSLQEYDEAITMHDAFARGYVRLEGTREVDPVTVLKVETREGEVLYEHGDDLQRVEVVDPGSVWMLHTMLSDCSARFLIWSCGSSNADNGLDLFMADGQPIPMGVKTGTQQGFHSSDDIQATWLAGYSRNSATAVWVGNADKSIVRDGPAVGWASSGVTRRVFKNWVSSYHDKLVADGVISGPMDFDDIRPDNVSQRSFQTAATERGMSGGCSQTRIAWQRTDIDYTGDCVNGYMPLPDYRRDLAEDEARSRGIPIRRGSSDDDDDDDDDGSSFTSNIDDDESANASGTTPDSSGGSGQQYVVQSGDICMSIANRFGVDVNELRSANNDLDCNRMQIGDVVRIP